MKNTTKGMLLIILAAVCWGIYPIFSRLAYAQGSDPMTVAALRAQLASVILIVYGVIRHIFNGITLKSLLYFAFMGTFTSVLGYLSYLYSVEMLAVSVAAVLLYTAPAFVIIFSKIIYKEPITKRKLIGLILTFIGCAIVVKLYDFQSLSVNALGLILGVCSGICYAMVTVLGRKALEKHTSEQVAIFPILFGGLVFLFMRPAFTVDWNNGTLDVYYIVIAAIGTAVPFLCYMKGMHLGVEGGNASLLATIEPVVTTLAGIVILGDLLDPIQFLGVGLVLVGAALPSFSRKDPPASDEFTDKEAIQTSSDTLNILKMEEHNL